MKTFHLTLSTPNGNAFDGEAEMLIVRGVEGELAVMAGHAPFVTTVVPCDVRITSADGEELFGHLDGGILSVATTQVTLLSGSFRLKA